MMGIAAVKVRWYFLLCLASSCVYYILRVECLRYMHSELQHLVVAEYYSGQFLVDLIPLLRYFIPVLGSVIYTSCCIYVV